MIGRGRRLPLSNCTNDSHLLNTYCLPEFVLSALHFTDKAPKAEAVCWWSHSWEVSELGSTRLPINPKSGQDRFLVLVPAVRPHVRYLT